MDDAARKIGGKGDEIGAGTKRRIPQGLAQRARAVVAGDGDERGGLDVGRSGAGGIAAESKIYGSDPGVEVDDRAPDALAVAAYTRAEGAGPANAIRRRVTGERAIGDGDQAGADK